MISFTVNESEPRPLIVVEVDPYADMHSPDQPYRVVLIEPDNNVLDVDYAHAVRNLTRSELIALNRAVHDLLVATDPRSMGAIANQLNAEHQLGAG